MDSNQAQLNNPPDLPGLESVEVNRKAVMGIFVMPFTLIAMVFVVFIMTSLLSGKVLVVAVPPVAMLLIIAILLIYRLLTEICFFKTDANGLHTQTITSKRFIRWSDVTSVDMIYGIGSSVTYQLSTSEGKLSIPSAITGYFRPQLIASIWQHLRREGSLKRLVLTSTAASLWDYIPNEIPNEMSWASSKKKKVYTSTSSYIQIASKRRSSQIQWENVSKAYWTCRDQRCGIFICGSAHKAVFIPHEPKDDASNQFVLCIIRHLKSVGVMIEIPESLRKARPVSIAAAAHYVNIRTSQPVCYIFPGLSLLLAMLPITRLAMGIHVAGTDDVITLSVLGTLSIVLFIAFSILNVKADDAGLIKRTIFGSKSMRWDDVVSYERVYGIYGRCISAIRLTGRKGAKVSIALADIFSTPDREKLIAYADYKLAHLLPTQEDQSPWLAQPSADLYDNTSIV